MIAKHKTSRSADRQEDMRENTAYNVIPLRRNAETPRQDPVEYEEVRTVSSDPEHHQYEKLGME